MRAKQEQEMEEVKRKAVEELQKCKREELQEQKSTAEQEDSEAPEDKSLQAQTDTEEADPAGSNGCIPIQRKEPCSPSLFSWKDVFLMRR